MTEEKRRITAEDLYKFELVSGLEISPDGRNVIYALQYIDQKNEKNSLSFAQTQVNQAVMKMVLSCVLDPFLQVFHPASVYSRNGNVDQVKNKHAQDQERKAQSDLGIVLGPATHNSYARDGESQKSTPGVSKEYGRGLEIEYQESQTALPVTLH